MKIIFLNCWYGKAGKPFFEFIENEKNTTDIFCFSEIQPNLYTKLSHLLKNHEGYYQHNLELESLGYIYGQSVFVNNNFGVKSIKRISIFRNVFNDVGFAQFMNLKFKSNILNVINVHGKARPGHKLDTPARIEQSKRIIDLFSNDNNPRIIGGDFNLNPNTKSVIMFEKAGYVDLIKKFKIKDTRGAINHSLYNKNEVQHYADYCFVSPDVKVKSFTVPDIEISDRLPLILEFEL